MSVLVPALDILADNLQEPLTRILMFVCLVFGYIRTRWYWIVIFALMVAISHVLATHDMTINQRVIQRAGETTLIIFFANGALMLASYAVGYGFKKCLLLISGRSPPETGR
jgi:hypothetical protein